MAGLRKACCVPMCAGIAENKGRCQEHARVRDERRQKQRDERRLSASARGYNAVYQRLRPMVIRRDQGCCVICRAEGVLRPGLEVDHIQPLSDGGANRMENLRTICKTHHRQVTEAYMQSRRATTRQPSEEPR